MGLKLMRLTVCGSYSPNPFQNCGWQGALPQAINLVRQGTSNAARRNFEMDSK